MEEDTNNMLNASVVVIGCGGVGTWVANLSARNPNVSDLLLIDRDKVEVKNLARQPFDVNQVGLYKAAALAGDLGMLFPLKGIDARLEYVDMGITCEDLGLARMPNMVYLLVDNHPARAAILNWADRERFPVVVAANETTDAEAYVYLPDWKGGRLDPRVYYPEILTDTKDDPLRPSCNTEEQVTANPQLPTANFNAASHALWLGQFWMEIVPTMPAEAPDTVELWDTFPFHVTSTAGRIRCWHLGELDEHERHHYRG